MTFADDSTPPAFKGYPGKAAAMVVGVVTALSLVVFPSGCAGAHGRGASGPDLERQSDAEYDMARELFLTRRDPRGALEHAQKSVELNDANAESHHLIALLYLYFCASSPHECRLSEAEKSARKAVEVKDDFREAQNTLGVVLIQEKRYDEAVRVLQKLSNDMLYQTPWDAWGNLGLAQIEKGDVDAAIESLRRSIAAEPRFCVGNYRLGLAYEKKGDLIAAREALSRAVETERPECQAFQDAFEARGRVLLKSRNCREARNDWERCKQIGATSPTGVRCATQLTSQAC